MSIKTAIFGLLSLVGVSLAFTQANPDAMTPLVGTWRLEVQRSRFEPGPAPTSSKMTIQDKRDGFISAVTEVLISGRFRNITRFELKCDEREYPFEVQMETATARGFISCTVAGERKYVFALKEGGTLIQKITRTVSADGVTLTDTMNGPLPDGQIANIVAVFRKQ